MPTQLTPRARSRSIFILFAIICHALCVSDGGSLCGGHRKSITWLIVTIAKKGLDKYTIIFSLNFSIGCVGYAKVLIEIGGLILYETSKKGHSCNVF